ncbi:hypothetical protein VTP01DRAFT_2721 [Rhizomucor pusillus]|uniref:uncharacterized protein n=1 Tax=Rhizomucor pusillus TaxID=4840 RepID=UPI003743D662
MTTITDRIHVHAQSYNELAQKIDPALERELEIAVDECEVERDRVDLLIKDKHAKYLQVAAKAKEEFQRLRKLKNTSMRYMSGSKREKRMASEQQYQALFEREQTYKNDVENLSRRLDELSRQHAELASPLNDIKAARGRLRALMDEIFDAPHDSSFPLEPQLKKAELQEYLKQRAETSEDRDRYEEAEHTLTLASKALIKTLKTLDSATQPAPLGTSVEYYRFMRFEAAKKIVPHEIQRRLVAAKEKVPEIPNKDRLDCGTLGGFMIMRFDDPRYISKSWKMTAKRGYMSLYAVHSDIAYAIRWTRQRKHELNNLLDHLRYIINTTESALEYERRRIIEYTLSGGTLEALFHEERQQEPPRYDLPPPSYEEAV